MLLLKTDQITNRTKGIDRQYQTQIIVKDSSIQVLSDDELMELFNLVQDFFDPNVDNEEEEELFHFLSYHFTEVQDVTAEFGGAMKYLDIGLTLEPTSNFLKDLEEEIENRELFGEN